MTFKLFTWGGGGEYMCIICIPWSVLFKISDSPVNIIDFVLCLLWQWLIYDLCDA